MDRIERDVLIAAPAERVWAVLTEPEHIAGWFGDTASGDPHEGGELVLGWKEYGDSTVIVERYQPHSEFAFRWATEAGLRPAPGNSTLVEFTLTPEGDGTRLRVVESGFESLDMTAERQTKHAEDNTDGWRIELGELKEYAESLGG
jgi:uncharacterized protein YndB with AHSA1/START domain